MIGLKREPFADNGDDLIDLPSHDENFESQHMLLGFELLRWQFQDYMKEVAFIDPFLATMYLRGEGVPQRAVLKKRIESLKNQIHACFFVQFGAMRLFHWTLLTAERLDKSQK